MSKIKRFQMMMLFRKQNQADALSSSVRATKQRCKSFTTIKCILSVQRKKKQKMYYDDDEGSRLDDFTDDWKMSRTND